jgi:hypothetical protein
MRGRTYVTESRSMSPPKYLDKSPEDQHRSSTEIASDLQMWVACSITGPWMMSLFHQS